MEEKDRLQRGILLTGASGFIGGAVLARLGRIPDLSLRTLVHRSDLPAGGPAGIEIVKADLSVPASLEGICRNIGTVIHAASYIGDDAERCQAVNARGTEALAAQARAAGVGRFIYLSNTAVYGFGIHRGAAEKESVVRPATAISRSRVQAEKAVLAAGGTVLRPTFVYGRGDRHFLPALIRALDRFPFLINGGRARLSVISVEELAEVIVALAAGGVTGTGGETFHVNDGRPVSLKGIVTSLARTTGTRRPRLSLPYPIARLVMGLAAGLLFDKDGRRSSAHRLFLVSRDHYYSAARLRRAVSWPAGLPFDSGLALCADWYRSFRRGPAGES